MRKSGSCDLPPVRRAKLCTQALKALFICTFIPHFHLREGALTLTKLIDLAVHDQQPALAITDTNNLFAALEFAEKAAKYGVQPITGIQLSVDFADGDTSSAIMRRDPSATSFYWRRRKRAIKT